MKSKRHTRAAIAASAVLIFAAALTVGALGAGSAKDGGLAGNEPTDDEMAAAGLAPISGKRTYYLENATEKQMNERLYSVTLYGHGAAELAAPRISSYLPPECTYSVSGSAPNAELLILASVEGEEETYGVKNGEAIARFAIADGGALVFQSSAVPLFADAGARYVCPPPGAYKWLDNSGQLPPWETGAELTRPEFPGTVFRWTSDRVTAVGADGGETELFSGMPVWSVYLQDLTGDGLPEFCAAVSFGSGIVSDHIAVYDYAAGKQYTLSDRMYYDYSLSAEGGRLLVTQHSYNGGKLAEGRLAIVNGELAAEGIDRSHQGITESGSAPYNTPQPGAQTPLDAAVSMAIISEGGGGYMSGEGVYQTEAHATLETVEDGDTVTVYAVARSSAYTFSGGRLSDAGGSVMPVAITFDAAPSGGYSLTEYWMPEDGDRYFPSIMSKFPMRLWLGADTQLYTEELSLAVLRNAQDRFGIADRVKPEITVIKPLEFERGATPGWAEYIKITDDADGGIPLSEAYIWDALIDFGKSGKYDFQVIVSDKAGNETRAVLEASVK